MNICESFSSVQKLWVDCVGSMTLDRKLIPMLIVVKFYNKAST